jgi:hypothetical protein
MALPFLVLFPVVCAGAQSSLAGDPPNLTGIITDVASPTEFTVEKKHVVCVPKSTISFIKGGDTKHVKTACLQPILGEEVAVYGQEDRHTKTITATEIDLDPMQGSASGAQKQVSGQAIIDDVLAPPHAGDATFRADGYPLRFDASSKLAFSAPLNTLADVTTNVWVRYSGRQQPDGSVLVEQAAFVANQISDHQDKVLAKEDYDPSTVTEEQRQSGASKFFGGVNPKKIPAYHDAAMQQRVETIGNRLIPAYQRALPKDDKTRLGFTFQVIDEKRWRDALVLPNGIVLVPRQVVERLPNDSQLAAVLADNMAIAMEKQSFRMEKPFAGMSAANVAGAVGGIFIPGLGLATQVATGSSAAVIVRRMQEQGDRVSLGMLHDAGYDMTQAPVTWWLLSSGKPATQLTETKMPHRTRYLYSMLATVWQTTPEHAAADAPHP